GCQVERRQSRHNICFFHSADRYRACCKYSHSGHSAGYCQELQRLTIELSDIHDQWDSEHNLSQPHLCHSRWSTVHVNCERHQLRCIIICQLERLGAGHNVCFRHAAHSCCTCREYSDSGHSAGYCQEL